MLEFTTTRRVLRAIASCAPTVDVRFYLVGVHVRADHRGIILEATDGHVLARLRISPVPVSAPVSVILPLKAVQAITAGGKKALDDILTVTIDGARITITDASTIHTPAPIDGKYLDPDPIVRKAIAAPVELAQFNPELLERLFACVKMAAGTDKAMPWYSQRGTNPCIVTCEALPEFIGLVMPWRADDVAIPVWVQA